VSTNDDMHAAIGRFAYPRPDRDRRFDDAWRALHDAPYLRPTVGGPMWRALVCLYEHDPDACMPGVDAAVAAFTLSSMHRDGSLKAWRVLMHLAGHPNADPRDYFA
jgi:hypothetical protein